VQFVADAGGGNGRVSLIQNSAGRSGGGVLAFGSEAVVIVGAGARLVAAGNSAALDGGGLALTGGASLIAAAGGCPAATCPSSLRGNGACNPECMMMGCNWYIPKALSVPKAAVPMSSSSGAERTFKFRLTLLNTYDNRA
jgi:hypothetical protein